MSESGPYTPHNESAEEREYELRGLVGAYWTGGRLLIGMFAFLFASLAFAYFYLRSNNSGDLWRPNSVTAPTSFGWAIWAIVLTSAFLILYGQAKLRAGSVLDWKVSTWIAVVGALLAIGLQIDQLTRLPFYPGSSGYASCFIGWAVMNLMGLFGGLYWIETLGARAIRLGPTLPVGETLSDSPHPEAQLFRASVQSAAAFWTFLAVVGTLFWAFFYLI